MKLAMVKYQKGWLDKAVPFFKQIVPSGIPDKVVYPFGGHDLITALTVFPDAVDYTTISLEGVGDARAIDTLTGSQWNDGYNKTEHDVIRLLTAAFSATTELNDANNTLLPGGLFYALTALAIHGYEPIALRYFRIESDGSLHYLEQSDIDAADKALAESKKKTKKQKDQYHVSQDTFDDMELTFRKAGDANAPLKTYRHIAADLSNDKLPADAPLIKFLKSKGKVAAMTKAASHLLWYDSFSNIRDYLLDDMAWMVSDATGVPPAIATKAGFVQETYGIYEGSYMEKFPHHNKAVERDFIKLWKANPKKELPMKFGYFDKGFRNNLVVTRPK
jgi:hypothetical protein